MEELWQATAATIRGVLEKTGVSPREVLGVGCTGHGKGLYLWGRDGRPAYDAIASTDHRAQPIVDRWRGDGTADKALEKTLQRVIDCQPAPLLRWMKEQQPEVYENIRWIFEAKDYIRFRLTGEAFGEVTDYSGTSLMNLTTQSFDRELLALYGLEEIYGCLPPLKYSYENCGRVTGQAAEETGCRRARRCAAACLTSTPAPSPWMSPPRSLSAPSPAPGASTNTPPPRRCPPRAPP